MRTLLIIPVLTAAIARGGEVGAPTVREKLRAKIMESAPPPSPSKASAQANDDKEAVVPAVVMKPVVVAESKVVRDVTATLAREEQEKREEQFSPLNGGTIYSMGRLRIGGWWSPSEGWTFLRLNKGPSQRQADATEATLKELQELDKMSENRRATPQPDVARDAAKKTRP